MMMIAATMAVAVRTEGAAVEICDGASRPGLRCKDHADMSGCLLNGEV